MVNTDNLIWLDLEMTGLEPETDRIIEIATIVTDSQLNILEEGPVFAIHQDATVIDSMGEWCTKVHGENGLTDRVKNSNISEAEAEAKTIAFLEKYQSKGMSPMCGNSIGQDRRFLHKYMRELHDFFHYRNLDVSTLKELAKRWKPELLDHLNKDSTHQALEDIRESINELKYYKDHFFNIDPNSE